MREIFDSTNPLFKELFQEEAAAEQQSQLYHLVRVDLPSPESPIYIVDNNTDVVYDGITYVRFPLKISEISANSDGTINKASISIANVSREMMAYVSQYRGLRGCRVYLKSVYDRFVDFKKDGTINEEKDVDAYLEDEFIIDNYSSSETIVQFNLDPVIDMEVKLPRRRFSASSCYFSYKDTDTCAYVDHGASIVNSDMSISMELLTGMEIGTNVTVTRILPTNLVINTTVTYVDTVNSHITLANSTGLLNGQSVRISLPKCKKSLADCKAHGNQQRFGGFPGVPTTTRRLVL